MLDIYMWIMSVLTIPFSLLLMSYAAKILKDEFNGQLIGFILSVMVCVLIAIATFLAGFIVPVLLPAALIYFTCDFWDNVPSLKELIKKAQEKKE